MLTHTFLVELPDGAAPTTEAIRVLDAFPRDPPQTVKTKLSDMVQQKVRAQLRAEDQRAFFFVQPLSRRIQYSLAFCGMIPQDPAVYHKAFRFLGLIFEPEDNPLDYQAYLNEQLFKYEQFFSEDLFRIKPRDFGILLPSVFVNLRAYAHEVFFPRAREQERRFKTTVLKMFIFGLDAAGKSTFVNFLKTGRFVENLLPTRRRDIQSVKLDGRIVRVWDMPGQQVLRKSWLRGMYESDILVYLVDVNDRKRFEMSKIELWNILNRWEVAGVPVAILANKSDLLRNGRISRQEFIREFDLDRIRNREWALFFTSIKDGVSVDESIAWITSRITAEVLNGT